MNASRNATRSRSDSNDAIALIVNICKTNNTASHLTRLYQTFAKLASR